MANVSANLASWSTTANSNEPDSSADAASVRGDLQQIQATVRKALAYKGSDISSASPSLINTDGFFHDVTGTTAITSFGTVDAGITKVLKFEGALTLTHNATSLIIPGGANITTANGDMCQVTSEGSGNWRVNWYQKANGQAIVSNTPSGSITASGYTQTTARLLGRTTAATGAIEEITVGSGLSLAGGTLTASAAGGARTQWRTSFQGTSVTQPSSAVGYLTENGLYQATANPTSTYNAATHSLDIVGNGSIRNEGGIYWGATPTFGTGWKASADPTVIVRTCPLTANANDRFIGLAGAQISAGSAPTNGIYFRFNTSGNYIFVCRSASTESTVDTGTAATAGTLVNLKWVSSSNGTSIQAYVNDVAAGSPITTNIPSAALGFSYSTGVITNTVGLRVADIFIEQDME